MQEIPINKALKSLIWHLPTIAFENLRKGIGDSVENSQVYKYDIFLSHSSYNLQFTNDLYRGLTNCGYQVFYSNKEFNSNEKRTIDFLSEGLVNSKTLLLIATPNAMKSHWVNLEYKTFFSEFMAVEGNSRPFVIYKPREYSYDIIPMVLRRYMIKIL